MKILHCYSKGDIRFSAYGARVKVFGIEDTIEYHYQLAKVFDGIPRPSQTAPWKAKLAYTKTVKQLQRSKVNPTHLIINGKQLPVDYLSQWYKLLWATYFESNPDLVKYASEFDEFLDIYAKGSKNNQADVIKQYVKEGKGSVINDCRELMKLLMQKAS